MEDLKQLKPLKEIKKKDSKDDKDSKDVFKVLDDKMKKIKEIYVENEIKLKQCYDQIDKKTKEFNDLLIRIKIANDIIKYNNMLTETEVNVLIESMNKDINNLIIKFVPEVSKSFDMNYFSKIENYSTSIDDVVYELILKKNK